MSHRATITATAAVIIFIVISVIAVNSAVVVVTHSLTHGAQIKEDIIKFVLCTHAQGRRK